MPQKTISANTLFHFTISLKNLTGILINDFYPRYCLEDFSDFLEHEYRIAIPMVCFCDIPLSQINNHVKYYGGYALGLNKEWGRQNKISPIIYSYNGSFSAQYFNTTLHYAQDFNTVGIVDQINRLLQFVKPYEGKLYKNNTESADLIRFYDEREWRFVPEISVGKNGHARANLTEKEYRDVEILRRANGILANDTFSLSFEPKDIKYIIVNKESEVHKMLKNVISIKGPKFSYDDVQLLTTRIISMEQVAEVF